jgi:hypothetical protein
MKMWKDAVATNWKVIMLVHILSEAIGEHFQNAQSGQLSYPTRFTSVRAGMLGLTVRTADCQISRSYVYLGLFIKACAVLSGEGN